VIPFEQVVQLNFMWPRMLWLLAPLPLLVGAFFWLAARRQRSYAALTGLLAPAGRGRAGWLRRALPPLLLLLALAAWIGAVSRPQANVLLPSLHKDLMLALDISGSMRATDVKPDRMTAAKAAARAFIDRQPSYTRIGIVAIAGTASVVQSPTDNREDLYQALERLQPQKGSALGSGIYIALATLLPDAGIDLEQLVQGRSWAWPRAPQEPQEKIAPGSNRTAAIVLLSDGETNFGPDPLEAAKLAAEHGVRVHAIGIGTREGAPLEYAGWSMRVQLDEDMLRKIATTTLGEYYAAASAPQLEQVYEHLSAKMIVERTRTVEMTVYLVAAGALLLLLSAFLSVLWFNRVA
jgi:Ca-activated chloride channel family protein